NRAHPARVLELLGGALEPQVELLLLQRHQLVDQLVVRLGAQLLVLVDLLARGGPGRFLGCSCHGDQSAMRATTRVVMGSFMAPRRSASRAVTSGTPSTSNRMRPGFTRAAQNSTAP